MVQKQPFLMSDTFCPQDAFNVSNSLIKQHPREQDRGHMKCVCVYVYNFLVFELSGVIWAL